MLPGRALSLPLISVFWACLAACSLAFGSSSFTGCSVTRTGIINKILLRGTILTPDGPIEYGHVLVHDGRIIKVGSGDAECQTLGPGRPTVVDCLNSVISPGFINAHEHIEYSTVNPLASNGVLYDHRHEWRVGLNGKPILRADVNGSDVDATKWGELRHIFSGTTSIIGGRMANGLARNLDFADGVGENIAAPADTWAVFPLDDAEGITRHGDCDYGHEPINSTKSSSSHRYIGHIGEGIGPEAGNEFECLSSNVFDTIPMAGGGGLSSDIIAPNVALVHALGLTHHAFDLVAKRGAYVVWSPRSNVFLYGKTLDVKYLLDAGITVSLGTDWLPSGSATMGREAVCARSAMEQSYGNFLEAKTLWEMMTINGAKVAGFEDELGSLEVGKLADIAVFSKTSKHNHHALNDDPYAHVAFAAEEHVELVMRGGKVLVASPSLESIADSPCESVFFGKKEKIVCVQQELNQTFAKFEAALDGVYPAVLPEIPPDEPGCDPSR